MTRKFVTTVMVALVMFASTAAIMPAQAAAQNNPVQKATNSIMVQTPA